jgi:hypothetical protein
VIDPVARQQLAAGGVLGAGRLAAAEGHPGGLLAQVGDDFADRCGVGLELGRTRVDGWI